MNVFPGAMPLTGIRCLFRRAQSNVKSILSNSKENHDKRERGTVHGSEALCFVLMPFDVAFDDIYEFGIKGACSDAGVYCERVDEQVFLGSMLERIFSQISRADLLIADMTGKNPNVFYEVGYAHALGKKVVLLTSVSQDIPFDLKHFPHIIYGTEIKTLRAALTRKLEYLIQVQNPRSDAAWA